MRPAQFKAARVALRYTQAALADHLDVSPSTIRRWEMEPSVKSSRKPNKFAVLIVDDMLAKRGIKIERE
jgi:DNA-binding XRE family transcriptional regulator